MGVCRWLVRGAYASFFNAARSTWWGPNGMAARDGGSPAVWQREPRPIGRQLSSLRFLPVCAPQLRPWDLASACRTCVGGFAGVWVNGSFPALYYSPPRSRLSPTPPHFFSLSFAEVKPSPAPARLPAPCRHLPGPSQGVNGVSGHGRLWLGLVRLSFLRLLFIVLGVPAARLLLILPDLSPLRCRLFIIAAAFLSRSEVGSLSVSALHAATTSRLTCLLKCLPGKVVI
jgi:hypothetical protein